MVELKAIVNYIEVSPIIYLAYKYGGTVPAVVVGIPLLGFAHFIGTPFMFGTGQYLHDVFLKFHHLK